MEKSWLAGVASMRLGLLARTGSKIFRGHNLVHGVSGPTSQYAPNRVCLRSLQSPLLRPWGSARSPYWEVSLLSKPGSHGLGQSLSMHTTSERSSIKALPASFTTSERNRMYLTPRDLPSDLSEPPRPTAMTHVACSSSMYVGLALFIARR